jgi:hypothetical protein
LLRMPAKVVIDRVEAVCSESLNRSATRFGL